MPPRKSFSGIGVRFVSDEVKRDHRDLEILYKGLAQAIDEGDDQTTAELQNKFCWEIARHLIAMQLLIFPGTNSRADQGNVIAVRRRGDLAVVSRLSFDRYLVCIECQGLGIGTS